MTLLDGEDIRALERLSLDSLEALVAGLFGRREGPGSSAGFEFTDYRRYIPGDDIRRIDWNLYARLHELHVRTAPREASLWLSVMLDASRSMESGEPDKLAWGRRLAVLLGAVALLRDDAVEIHTLSDGQSASTGNFDSGGRVLGAMMAQLEGLPAGRRTDLARSIRGARLSGLRPELAVLITDGLVAPAELEPALAELAGSARSATLVHLRNPADSVIGWEGSTLLVDAETGRRIDALITPDAQERYAERHRQAAIELERLCGSRGVRYILADTAIDALDFLFAGARRERLLALAGSA